MLSTTQTGVKWESRSVNGTSSFLIKELDQSVLSSHVLPSSTTGAAGGSAASSGGASTTGSAAVRAINSTGSIIKLIINKGRTVGIHALPPLHPGNIRQSMHTSNKWKLPDVWVTSTETYIEKSNEL